jgi:DNA-directed RNA polymerase subunit omega
MIEALKNEDLVRKVGGRFKLTALIQKRWLEIMQGSRPMVDRKKGMTDLDVAVQEIVEDKIGIDYEKSDVLPPDKLV